MPFLSRPHLISFRLGLLLTISTLLTVSGLLVVGNSYLRSKQIVEGYAMMVFHGISEQVVLKTSAHLVPAVPALSLLRLRMRDGLLAADGEALERELVEVLRSNPTFSWVNYGDARGVFTGAYRTDDGKYRVNRTVPEPDGTGTLVSSEVDDGDKLREVSRAQNDYDPRERPWYVQAKDVDHRIWTPPYVFLSHGSRGVTCSVADRTSAGVTRGVLAIDFDLQTLGAFVRTLRPSPNGRVIIFTRGGVVIARSDGPPEAKLTRVEELDDPVLRAFFAEVKERHSIGVTTDRPDTDEDVHFREGGARYLAHYNSFDIDGRVDWVVAAIAPEADFLGEVRHSNEISLFISAVALLVALVGGAILARRISGPLARLAREMEEVGKFRVEERPMNPTILREVAMMNRALLGMKRGLRSFGSYVPRDLVRAALASGQEAVLGGKTRTLSVFFSDLAGFTTTAETMTPDELVAFLGGYLDQMTNIIAQHHGTVDKFIGDGIMAFWGAPEDVADHAARSCEAALACQASLRRLQAERGAAGKSLDTRIGICSGDVLVGNIGTPQRMNYTVMGDVVNHASRLEGLNKLYGTRILVSESTFLAAKGRVVARPVDVVAVKGKARAGTVYEPLCLATDPDPAARDVAAKSELALAAYLARRFSEAEALFAAVIALRPGDQVAAMMMARCQRYAAAPPADEWTGAYVATEK